MGLRMRQTRQPMLAWEAPARRAVLSLGGLDEAARVQHPSWASGDGVGCMAVAPQRPEGDACSRLPWHYDVPLGYWGCGCTPSGTERSRLCRGTKPDDRISM